MARLPDPTGALTPEAHFLYKQLEAKRGRIDGMYLNASEEVIIFVVFWISLRVRLSTTAGMLAGSVRLNGAGFGSA